MPLPTNLQSLDVVNDGQPFVWVPAVSTIVLTTMDHVEDGLPFVAPPVSLSTDAIRVTQFVNEVLRSAVDAGGGNLRITQLVREVISLSSESIYFTQFARELMVRSAEVPKKGTSWMVFDEVNFLDVWVRTGTLTSAADDYAVLNGTNLALWGSELLSFRDVTFLGARRYRLRWLLRGRFGTEWAMNSHTLNEQFILMTTAAMRRRILTPDQLNLTKWYRAVTLNQPITSAVTRLFANTGVGLKPYAPCVVTGARDGPNNLTIGWTRRTRYDGEWRDYVNVGLGETQERYEVDVLSSTGGLLRTLTSLTESVVYSAANQTTDFGAVQSLITVVVYQMNEIVGRGYGTNRSV